MSDDTNSDGDLNADPTTDAESRRRRVARGTSLRRPETSKPLEQSTAVDSAAESDSSADSTVRPSKGPSTDDTDDLGAEGDSSDEAAHRSKVLQVAIVAAATALLILSATAVWLRPWAQPMDNRAFVDTNLTTEVASVAKQAAKQIYTLDMNNVEQWQATLGKLLIPSMVEEAKKYRTAITQVAGASQDVTVTVDDADIIAAVSLAQENHSEVLINMRQQARAAGVPMITVQVPMKIVLDRFDGTWKVSSITPL